MQKLLGILLITLLVGCNTFDLDEKWRPLEKIVERPDYVTGYSGFSTTVGANVYRANLDTFLDQAPPNSPRFEALMYHEQVHSVRQFKVGVKSWLARYLYDTSFMWAEEQLGWYVTITYNRNRGIGLIPEAIANSLSKYRNLAGRMVLFDVALNWVHAVINGQWKPGEADHWSLPEFARH